MRMCLFIKVDKSLGAKKRCWVLCVLCQPPSQMPWLIPHPPLNFLNRPWFFKCCTMLSTRLIIICWISIRETSWIVLSTF